MRFIANLIRYGRSIFSHKRTAIKKVGNPSKQFLILLGSSIHPSKKTIEVPRVIFPDERYEKYNRQSRRR